MSKKFIDRSLWESGDFQKLSRDAKSLYVYLYVICDLAGFVKRNDELFTFQTKIKDIAMCLKELKKLVIEEDRLLWLSNHLSNNSNIPLNPKNNAHKKIIHLFEIAKHVEAKRFFEGLSNTLRYKDNTLPYSTGEVRTPLEPPKSEVGMKEGEIIQMYEKAVSND